MLFNKCFAQRFENYELWLKVDQQKMITFLSDAKVKTLKSKVVGSIFSYPTKIFFQNEKFYLLIKIKHPQVGK